MSLYQLTLIAQDRGSPPLSTTVPVIISLVDVNDNSPVFARPNFIINQLENTNGTLIMDFNVCLSIKKLKKQHNLMTKHFVQVTDADTGLNGDVTFSLDPVAAGQFYLTQSAPFTASLFLTHMLDREARTLYNFSIYSRDRGNPTLTGSTQVTINVVVS